MKSRSRRSTLALLTLLLVAAALPAAWAQDDQDEQSSDRALRVYVEVGVWGAKPTGLEYEPASVDNGAIGGPQLLGLDGDANYEGWYEAALLLGEDFGAVRASWYGQTDERSLTESTPGSFIYGQLLSNPLFAGFANDGLADGFDSSAQTKLTEFRLDFERIGFQSKSITGKWFVGVRRVTHDRDLRATYYALSPDLPPLLPPQPGLNPIPESAQIGSSYTGRGIEGGMEVLLPIIPKRFELEGGFTLGVLSGKIDSSYLGTNYYYLYTPDPMQPEQTVILGPNDYDAIFGNSGSAARTTQSTYAVALQTQSRSVATPVMDLFLGLRGHVWKDLEVLLGFRNVFYGDVGVDLRPKVVTESPYGLNIQDVTEVDHSVEYQGGYFAVAYTF